MNAHLELLRKQSNYPTLRFLNLLVFRIGLFIGCLYIVFPLALSIYGQVEKDRQLSAFARNAIANVRDEQGNEKAFDFNGLVKVVFSLILYYIFVFIFFVFIYCFFEVSSMFIDMADNFLYFGSSS
jgi:hypothetical protein